MDTFDLNLSTRPFRPYRAANLGLLIVLLILAAVSIQQIYSYRHYSELSAGIRDNERKVREEADALTAELAAINSKLYRPDAAAKLTEVEFLNQLILRKSFSWTRVFANLERVMPEDVYVLNLRPAIDEKGVLSLNINVRGRSNTDVIRLVETLEQTDIFENVKVPVEQKKDELPDGEVELAISVDYVPERGAE